MKAEFHPLAARELVEDSAFYEARAKGLGARFLDAVERAVSLLETHPELGQLAAATIRAFPVRRFPYAVVYRIEADRLYVVAIANRRRKPMYWAGRTP